MGKIIKKNTLYIYTDGSSFSKPRVGGFGVIFVYLDKDGNEQSVIESEGGFKGATNNQMELYACVYGLEQVPYLKISIRYNLIEIRTDSLYVTGNLKRVPYWIKQQWFTGSGKPVSNVELWKKLLKLTQKQKCKVDTIWIKGHADDEYNKAVDKIAKQSAKGAIKPALSVVTLRRKKSKEQTKSGTIIHTKEPVTIYIVSSELLRQQKLYKYRYQVVDDKHNFNGDLDIAYSTICLGDAHHYSVIFNQNPKNSRILKYLNEVGKPKKPSSPYIKQLEALK